MHVQLYQVFEDQILETNKILFLGNTDASPFLFIVRK
jgi:hypothetical protein